MRAPSVHWKSLGIGLVLGVAVLALRGADESRARPGAFQVSAWGTAAGEHGAFVVNTESGEVVSIIGRVVVSTTPENAAEITKRMSEVQRPIGVYSVQTIKR